MNANPGSGNVKAPFMANQGDDSDLPVMVREIKRETAELIEIFDQVFLGTCGILWEDDIETRSGLRP